MRAKVACLLLALCLLAPALPAATIRSVDADAGILLIGSVPPAGYGISPGAITYLLGASVPVFLSDVFFLEPRLELYGAYYEWTGTNATEVPTNEELGTSFWTLNTIVSLQAGVQLPVSSTVALGGAIGLDFFLRFPLELFNKQTDSVTGQDAALGWFFGQGRFFYPESRLFVRWQFSPSIAFLANLRVMYPLFHAWDGLGQPFFDQLMGELGAGFSVKLGSGAAAGAASSTAGGAG
jgi:hypothetical protein